MKEQDAAHSFDKRVDAICEVCKFNDAIHYDNNKYFCCGCFAKELTRLRSELQEEKEINAELSKGLESAVNWVKKEFPEKFDNAMKEFGSLIKKAKLNN